MIAWRKRAETGIRPYAGTMGLMIDVFPFISVLGCTKASQHHSLDGSLHTMQSMIEERRRAGFWHSGREHQTRYQSSRA